MIVKNESKLSYDDVFVVLTFKNTDDVVELLDSMKRALHNYRVIIVNSYYDAQTKDVFEKIAEKYDCDFIPVENKGYGFGNNVGIAYALEHYKFKRLAISNPDIVIKEYDQQFLDQFSGCVIGGTITNARGKNQNPLRVIDWDFTNYSPYYIYVKNNRLLFYLSLSAAKIQRIKTLFQQNKIRVFSTHGSFFVICRDALLKTEPLFDENIFLFEEEIDIAKKFKQISVPVYYVKSIKVNHKEDGDVALSNLNNKNQMAMSCKYVKNKWSKG